jgi:hypothetical protein
MNGLDRTLLVQHLGVILMEMLDGYGIKGVAFDHGPRQTAERILEVVDAFRWRVPTAADRENAAATFIVARRNRQMLGEWGKWHVVMACTGIFIPEGRPTSEIMIADWPPPGPRP